MPMIYFVLAVSFSWLLLASFLVSASTYTLVQDIKPPSSTGQIRRSIFSTVRNIPLGIIACVAYTVAAIGLFMLWWTWRHNYVWICRCLVVFVADLQPPSDV